MIAKIAKIENCHWRVTSSGISAILATTANMSAYQTLSVV